MPSFPQFNPTRIRSYIFRLPLFTRGLIVAILALWIATIPFPWLREFAQLEPAKMDFTQSMFLFPLVEKPKKLEGLAGAGGRKSESAVELGS
jgi:hypothetical protein